MIPFLLSLIGSKKWFISLPARKPTMQQGWQNYSFQKMLDCMACQGPLPQIEILSSWDIFRGPCGRKWGLNCSSVVLTTPKQMGKLR